MERSVCVFAAAVCKCIPRRFHGNAEPFWVWIEDAENEHIYHHESFLLHKAKRHDEHKLTFTIPIFEPLPPQYFVKICSDRWLGNDITVRGFVCSVCLVCLFARSNFLFGR